MFQDDGFGITAQDLAAELVPVEQGDGRGPAGGRKDGCQQQNECPNGDAPFPSCHKIPPDFLRLPPVSVFVGILGIPAIRPYPGNPTIFAPKLKPSLSLRPGTVIRQPSQGVSDFAF
jgi:hypothetical protein